MEDLNFYYANYSRYVWLISSLKVAILIRLRIYNDVITLRKGSSYMYARTSIFQIRLPHCCSYLIIRQDKIVAISRAVSICQDISGKLVDGSWQCGSEVQREGI